MCVCGGGGVEIVDCIYIYEYIPLHEPVTMSFRRFRYSISITNGICMLSIICHLKKTISEMQSEYNTSVCVQFQMSSYFIPSVNLII